MKKFRSRWELLQRLSTQRRKLAELQVLRARAAAAEAAEKEQALMQCLEADAREFADLTAGPIPARMLLACRMVTAQHSEQLAALHAERNTRQQELQSTLQHWQQRSIEVDQTAQLTTRERQIHDTEQLAAEQLEIDEHSMAMRRTPGPRREEAL